MEDGMSLLNIACVKPLIKSELVQVKVLKAEST